MTKCTLYAAGLFLLIGLFCAGCQPREDAVETGVQPEPVIETAHKDPVCGMVVDPQSPYTITYEHQGQTYYFCSEECLKKFQADPDSYVRMGQANPGYHEH
jgi:YHS domain-containing protein